MLIWLLYLAAAIGAVGWSAHSATEATAPALYEHPVVAGGQAPDTIPAFPEARGWGATALATCRALPLVVHQVTNTNDSGAGSFRSALQATSTSNFDIVIFRTGGEIAWEGGGVITGKGCVYVAGQTAPGGGITLRGDSVISGGIEMRAWDDVVLRHFRMRRGGYGLRARGGHRAVWDHISLSWHGTVSFGGWGSILISGDTVLATSDSLSRFTVQNVMLYEQDVVHPILMMFSGRNDASPAGSSPAEKISVWGNWLAGPGWRLPKCSRVGGASGNTHGMQFVGNVVYNWNNRGGGTTGNCRMDFIGNYVKGGPGSSSGGTWGGRLPNLGDDDTSDGLDLHISANRHWVNGYDASLPDDSAWVGSQRYIGCRAMGSGWCPSNGAAVPDSIRAMIRRDTPLPESAWEIPDPIVTDSVLDQILARVGHSQRLQCDGTWTNVRDSADSLRVTFFNDSTGPTAIVAADTMVSPVPASGTACTDTDDDGIPDDWETAQCGSSTCVTADSVSVSGYLMIEHYLNGSDPDDPEPWAVENGNGNGNGEPATTFGSGRQVYKAPLMTYGEHSALRPDTAVIPLGTPFRAILNPARDSALVVTGTDLGTPLDSAAVQSTVDAWDLCNARGLCSAVDVRDVPIPGGDPGAMLLREWAWQEAA